MFRHIIKFAFRDIWNNKTYSSLSILGLAIAIAGALLMLLYVEDNLSWDKHWSNKDSLYRLTSFYPPKQNQRFSGESRTTPPVAAENIKKYFSQEVERVARLHEVYRTNFHIEDNENPYSQILVLADPSIVDMFDFDVIAGDLKDSITDPHKIALNDNLAINLFGSVDVVGKKISIESDVYQREYKVGAVYEDINEHGKPQTTVWIPVLAKLDDDYLLSIDPRFFSWNKARLTQTFVQLKEGASAKLVNRRMQSFLESHTGFEEYVKGVKYSEYYRWEMTPVKDTHLSPGSWNDLRYEDVYLIIFVAYVLVGLACINFVNLTVARLTIRTREASLRKILGASPKLLMLQVICEVFIVLVLGGLVGLACFEIISPYVSQFFMGFITFDYSAWSSYAVLLWVFIPSLILSSLYPAFVFSNVRPAQVLSANQSKETKPFVYVRSVLVVVQIIISTALIACSSIVYVQLNYGMNQGRNAELSNIHILGRSGFASQEELQAMLYDIPKLTSVESAIRTSRIPFGGGLWESRVTKSEWGDVDPVDVQNIRVGEGYFDFFNIKPIAGRVFEASKESDEFRVSDITDFDKVHHIKIVANEDLVRLFEFGSPENAIGKILREKSKHRIKGKLENVLTELEIIGVVPNAGLTSLVAEDPPMFYVFDRALTDESIYSLTLLKPKKDMFAVHKDVALMYKERFPEKMAPLGGSIENFSRGVLGHTIFMSRILLAMTLATICIAAIGVVGLMKVSVTKRTKEIGLRKVMGASTQQIIRFLLLQFSKPVLLGALIASAVSMYFLVGWLSAYSYRIPLWLIGPACLGASLLTLLITWVTVGAIAVKTAMAKPIESLRSE